MNDPVTSQISDSRIRNAFYGVSQFSDLIASIVLDTPRLSKAIRALFIAVAISIMFTFTTTVYAHIAVDFIPLTVALALLTSVMLVAAPIKIAAVSTGAGLVGLAFTPIIVPNVVIEFELLFAAAIVSVLAVIVTGAYVTKHVIIIASKVWVYKMHPDSPLNNRPEQPADETNTDA